MTITKLILMLVCLVSIPLETKEAKVTALFSKDLTEFPGKEGVMITVEYPPGSTDPIQPSPQRRCGREHQWGLHRRSDRVSESLPSRPSPASRSSLPAHKVGRNASQTKPAKFVVFFVKDKGAPILVPTS
jgi:hypothetical protein